MFPCPRNTRALHRYHADSVQFPLHPGTNSENLTLFTESMLAESTKDVRLGWLLLAVSSIQNLKLFGFTYQRFAIAFEIRNCLSGLDWVRVEQRLAMPKLLP
jgi:hypothetical protein